MLLIDTSGSMEYTGNCECTTPTCRECMPNCGAAAPERNRWANVLEVLTGEWNSYSCSIDAVRRGTSASGIVYSGASDENYFLPHVVHPTASPATQADNGILDTYIDRVRFGLMTFDAHPTYTPYGVLITDSTFDEAISNGSRGSYSYADSRGFRYFGCPDNEDRRVNLGSRSESAIAGRLVSVGFESDDPAIPSDDHELINADIQATLLTPDLRPQGGTPIAAMLEDLNYYFDTNDDVRPPDGVAGDPFRECRNRYAILLTDGRPNADFRGAPYYCEHYGGTDSGTGPSGGTENCPYELPEVTAADLVDNGDIEGLYVIGMNIAEDNTDARAILNTIATAGETCPTGGGDCARFPANAAELRVDFEDILRSAAPGTTTRTVPAFSGGGGGVTGGGQFQFQTGFNPTFSTRAFGYQPWQGVLERRRFECSASGVPEAQPIDATDRFHDLLNSQGTRSIWTVLPTTASDINGHLTGPARAGDATDPPVPAAAQTGVLVSAGMTGFNASNVTPDHLGIPLSEPNPTQLRDEVVDFVLGAPGTTRADKKMGSIYHSSPVIIGAPGADRSDETFNDFRQLIGDRPRVVYVGTNDGMLHAFLAGDYIDTSTTTPTTIPAGTELWAFIPPILLDELEDTMTSHQWMLDGTPVVQNVITVREGVGSADDWRTVLMMGFRQGAHGYFAMDVTDPFNPRFLWQYTDSLMGQTYGEPRFAQINVEFPSGDLHQRTVAILPGGSGVQLTGTNTPTDLRHIPATVGAITPRAQRRNWDTQGRSLYIVDVQTGALLKRFDNLPSPLTGGVSVFPGSVGADAQAAYFNDHDGIIWRLDLSSTDPDDWDYQAIWDMFHDSAADAGQPAYNAPLLSIDNTGNVVIIQATGNVDILDEISVNNRVVSLTENLAVSTTTGLLSSIAVHVNWDVIPGSATAINRLRPGEQITGPLELFNGVVYFGTFVTEEDATNACAFGYSRLWGIDYIENEGDINSPLPRLPHPVTDVDRVNFDPSIPGFEGLDNALLMGVGVAARPRCTQGLDDPDETDPYVGNQAGRYHVTDTSQPQYQLVAQISGTGSGSDGGSVGTIDIDLETPPVQVRTVGAVRRVE